MWLLPVRLHEMKPHATYVRDQGLALISRINRWMIGAAVGAVALLSVVAANAFKGHTLSNPASAASSSSAGNSAGSASPSSSSAASPSSSVGSDSSGSSGLAAPSQAPAPAPAAPAPVVSGGS